MYSCDFTNTRPDSLSDQVYFKRDLPSNQKGKVIINFKNLPAGKYEMNVYQTGYKVNDAYTTYLEIGAPSQLTREQVQTIKQKTSGTAIIQKTIVISAGKTFSETLDLRENDVFLVTINRI
jgi:xylan 1,4-beta-xylosidase